MGRMGRIKNKICSPFVYGEGLREKKSSRPSFITVQHLAFDTENSL